MHRRTVSAKLVPVDENLSTVMGVASGVGDRYRNGIVDAGWHIQVECRPAMECQHYK